MHRTRSWNTRKYRSISPTCSLAAVVLTSKNGIISFILLNYLSISSRFTTTPPLSYTMITFWRDLVSIHALRFGTNSTIPNLIFLEKVTKNGIPLRNIMLKGVESNKSCFECPSVNRLYARILFPKIVENKEFPHSYLKKTIYYHQ